MNLYNLILKAVDIPAKQLEAFGDHLQSNGIEIFAIAHNSIEAKFSGEYMRGGEYDKRVGTARMGLEEL